MAHIINNDHLIQKQIVGGKINLGILVICIYIYIYIYIVID